MDYSGIILICGYNDMCGQEIVENIIKEILTDVKIVKASKFFKIYPHINSFDHIFLCRRNVKDFTKETNEYSKYIELYNCWSLFSNLIIPYDDDYVSKWYSINKLLSEYVNEPSTTNKNNLLPCFLTSNSYSHQ
jgi:hypothetical protein